MSETEGGQERSRELRVDQGVLCRQAIDACRQALYFVELMPVAKDAWVYIGGPGRTSYIRHQ
jgi:hypothetical protein